MKFPGALQAHPKLTGLEQGPKGICKDRAIGTEKGVGRKSRLTKHISNRTDTEQVEVEPLTVPVMGTGGMASSRK